MKFKYIEHKTGRVQRALIRRLTNKPARMQRAKGPGSYDCVNDIHRLAQAGEFDAARELYERHVAVRGVTAPKLLQIAVRLWPRGPATTLSALRDGT